MHQLILLCCNVVMFSLSDSLAVCFEMHNTAVTSLIVKGYCLAFANKLA